MTVGQNSAAVQPSRPSGRPGSSASADPLGSPSDLSASVSGGAVPSAGSVGSSGGDGRRRGLRGVLRDPAAGVLVVLLAAFVAARVWVIGSMGAAARRLNDSASYAPLPGDGHPGSVVSLTGHSPRPWGVPVLFALVAEDPGRVVLQSVVGIVAWVVLAVGLWVTMRTSVARVVVVAVLLLVGLTRPVLVWDFLILSESLSISLGLFVLGAVLVWVRTRWWPVLAAAVVVAVWWLFTRQDVLLFVAVLAVVLAVVAWRRRDRRRPALVAVVVLVLGMGWLVAIAPVVDRTFAGWSASGTSQTQETFLYRLHVQVMRNPEIRRAHQERLGMPPCPEAVAVSEVTTRRWNIREFVAAYRRCPDLVAWGERNRFWSAPRFAVTAPGLYLRVLGESLPPAIGGGSVSTYRREVNLLPRPVDRVVFQVRRGALPAAATAFGVLLVVAVLAGAFRRGRWAAWLGVGLVAVSLASVLAALALSAGEYGRFGIQESVLLRVGLILMLGAAVDALVQRYGSRRRSTPAAAVSGAADQSGPWRPPRPRSPRP